MVVNVVSDFVSRHAKAATINLQQMLRWLVRRQTYRFFALSKRKVFVPSLVMQPDRPLHIAGADNNLVTREQLASTCRGV